MAQDPLHLLCIEPRFPGRLGAVADWLARRRGYRCQFFFNSADRQELWPESVGKGLDLVQFNVGGVAREQSVHWTRQLERAVCYAYGCWEVLDARRPRPVDLVLGRSAGLGSTLFAPVYLPGVPIVNLFDYYFHPHANDLADESAESPVEYFHWRRSAVAMELLDLENGVTPWTPTEWQRRLFPAEYQDDFEVLYDGVDVRRFPAPNGSSGSTGPRHVAGRTVAPGTRVVSFVARSLDRTRGFDRFVALANRLLRARSDVLCVVVGDSTVQRNLDVHFYNQDFRGHVLSRTPLYDSERVWFVGAATPPVVAEVFKASDLHVYPSRPYVVSRSLVEAMGAGCVILACDTEPLREFISDGESGLLVAANDLDAWFQRALAVLADPAEHRPLGRAAAALARERYSQEVTLPNLAMLFDQLVSERA